MKQSIFPPLFRSISPALLLLTFSSMRAYTQDLPPCWSLAIEGGPAFPVGAFHSKAYPSNDAGYARTGLGAELSVTYRFRPSFGFTLAAGLQKDPSEKNISYDAIYDRKDWTIGSLLAGPEYERSLSTKNGLALRVRAMAGIQKTRFPDFTVYGDNSNGQTAMNEYSMWTYGPLPWAFAYQADAGVKWAVERHIALTLDAGYAGSRNTLNYTYNVTEDIALSINGNDHRPIATGTIQCRIGIEIGI